MLECLFNRVTDLKVCSFIKQRLQHRCFHVNIAKFFRTAFFIRHLRWLLLNKLKTNVSTHHLFFTWLAVYYVFNSIMTLNSKDSAKLQRYSSRNTNKQKHEKLNIERRKPSFTKRIGGYNFVAPLSVILLLSLT